MALVGTGRAVRCYALAGVACLFAAPAVALGAPVRVIM
jgi:hypothetical protein